MLNSGECCHCENWYVANHWHMQDSWLQACCHQRLAHWQFSEGSGVSPWFWGQVPAEMAWDERHDAELQYDLGMDHGGPRSIWMPTAIQAPERCPNLVSLGQERQWDNKPVKFKEPKEAKEVTESTCQDPKETTTKVWMRQRHSSFFALDANHRDIGRTFPVLAEAWGQLMWQHWGDGCASTKHNHDISCAVAPMSRHARRTGHASWRLNLDRSCQTSHLTIILHYVIELLQEEMDHQWNMNMIQYLQKRMVSYYYYWYHPEMWWMATCFCPNRAVAQAWQLVGVFPMLFLRGGWFGCARSQGKNKMTSWLRVDILKDNLVVCSFVWKHVHSRCS